MDGKAAFLNWQPVDVRNPHFSRGAFRLLRTGERVKQTHLYRLVAFSANRDRLIQLRCEGQDRVIRVASLIQSWHPDWVIQVERIHAIGMRREPQINGGFGSGRRNRLSLSEKFGDLQ
jgi:hypothetical protein